MLLAPSADLLSSSRRQTLWTTSHQFVPGELRKRFNDLTVESSEAFTYLGMCIEIDEQGRYSIKMCDYIVKKCENHFRGTGENFTKGSMVPAGRDLFKICEDSKLLDVKMVKQFHSTTARVLYITNRTKQTQKIACQFLCTRMKAPTGQDERKLAKLLSNVWKTQAKKFLFERGNGRNALRHCRNGAFTVHSDGKSHGGLAVEYGGSTINCGSGKHKICTEDSTSSEGVLVSDYLPKIEWFGDFLTDQGDKITSKLFFRTTLPA